MTLAGDRPGTADWDGRITRVTVSEGTTEARVTTRVKDSATQARLTFPTGVTVRYTYSGQDLVSVENLATGAVWTYTFDGWHNLDTERSPLEQGTTHPLVDHDTVTDATGHISQVTTWLPRAPALPRDQQYALFNTLNLPTERMRYARAGGGLPNQLTSGR